MSKEVKYSLNIRIEDFRLDQSKIHALIAEIMGIESAEFIAFTNYVNGRGIEINKDIDKSLTIPELTNSEINYINSFLSRSIMKEIGYDFL